MDDSIMTKKKSDYVTIKLPSELVEEIDSLIGKYGFKSRGEIVKEAVRRFLDHYRNIVPLHVAESKKAEK